MPMQLPREKIEVQLTSVGKRVDAIFGWQQNRASLSSEGLKNFVDSVVLTYYYQFTNKIDPVAICGQIRNICWWMRAPWGRKMISLVPGLTHRVAVRRHCSSENSLSPSLPTLKLWRGIISSIVLLANPRSCLERYRLAPMFMFRTEQT